MALIPNYFGSVESLLRNIIYYNISNTLCESIFNLLIIKRKLLIIDITPKVIENQVVRSLVYNVLIRNYTYNDATAVLSILG